MSFENWNKYVKQQELKKKQQQEQKPGSKAGAKATGGAKK